MGTKIVRAYIRLLNENKMYSYSDGYIFVGENGFSEGFFTCDFIGLYYDVDSEKTLLQLVMMDFDEFIPYIVAFECEEEVLFNKTNVYLFKSVMKKPVHLLLTTEIPTEANFSAERLYENLQRVKRSLNI